MRGFPKTQDIQNPKIQDKTHYSIINKNLERAIKSKNLKGGIRGGILDRSIPQHIAIADAIRFIHFNRQHVIEDLNVGVVSDETTTRAMHIAKLWEMLRSIGLMPELYAFSDDQRDVLLGPRYGIGEFFSKALNDNKDYPTNKVGRISTRNLIEKIQKEPSYSDISPTSVVVLHALAKMRDLQSELILAQQEGLLYDPKMKIKYKNLQKIYNMLLDLGVPLLGNVDMELDFKTPKSANLDFDKIMEKLGTLYRGIVNAYRKIQTASNAVESAKQCKTIVRHVNELWQELFKGEDVVLAKSFNELSEEERTNVIDEWTQIVTFANKVCPDAFDPVEFMAQADDIDLPMPFFGPQQAPETYEPAQQQAPEPAQQPRETPDELSKDLKQKFNNLTRQLSKYKAQIIGLNRLSDQEEISRICEKVSQSVGKAHDNIYGGLDIEIGDIYAALHPTHKKFFDDHWNKILAFAQKICSNFDPLLYPTPGTPTNQAERPEQPQPEQPQPEQPPRPYQEYEYRGIHINNKYLVDNPEGLTQIAKEYLETISFLYENGCDTVNNILFDNIIQRFNIQDCNFEILKQKIEHPEDYNIVENIIDDVAFQTYKRGAIGCLNSCQSNCEAQQAEEAQETQQEIPSIDTLKGIIETKNLKFSSIAVVVDAVIDTLNQEGVVISHIDTLELQNDVIPSLMSTIIKEELDSITRNLIENREIIVDDSEIYDEMIVNVKTMIDNEFNNITSGNRISTENLISFLGIVLLLNSSLLENLDYTKSKLEIFEEINNKFFEFHSAKLGFFNDVQKQYLQEFFDVDVDEMINMQESASDSPTIEEVEDPSLARMREEEMVDTTMQQIHLSPSDFDDIGDVPLEGRVGDRGEGDENPRFIEYNPSIMNNDE